LFKQVSTTSKSATGVTAGGLGQMQVAITGITKTIQSLPGTVGSSSAGVVTSFMRMGSTVGSYFNSTFIPAMKTYGERLMEQLAAGITKGAPQVEAALNKSGVGSPQSGGALAGMSAGTENNYYIDTMNLEAQNPSQLAQQLQQKSRTANATGGSKRAG
jgi:hypothetical protein